MKKMLYLLYFDINNDQSIGVKNKIMGQIKAYNKNNVDVTLAYLESNFLIFISKNKTEKIEVTKGLSKYRNSIKNEVTKYLENNIVNYMYIRFPGSIEPVFYSSLRKFSQLIEELYLELPTYPIKGEFISALKDDFKQRRLSFIYRSLVYLLHGILKNTVKKFITNIVTFMPYDEIWGIQTIVLDNGIDTDKFPVIKKNNHSKFTMIGVANLSKWHGYDRLILGIRKYIDSTKNEDILFNIVGTGNEEFFLKNLVKELELTNNVKFLGVKRGSELQEIYRKSDVGVGSLGMHRINVLDGSTLKVKEYCSYGIPFIYGYNEVSLTENNTFSLKVPSDESAIDVDLVRTFYNEISSDSNLSNVMHSFAVANFEWDKQIKRIVGDD